MAEIEKLSFKELILKNAQKINELLNVKHDKFPNDIYDNLAFPNGLDYGLNLLRKKDPETIEISLEYLKADPIFFRSGYIKTEIARILKRIDFTSDQKKELQDLLIKFINTNGRREYSQYCKLAAKISDKQFQDRIQSIIQSSKDTKIISRANLMLSYILK